MSETNDENDEFQEYTEGVPVALTTLIRKSDREIMEAGESASFDPLDPVLSKGELRDGTEFSVKQTAVGHYDNAIVVDFTDGPSVHFELMEFVRQATSAAKQNGSFSTDTDQGENNG